MKTILDYAALILVSFLPSNETSRRMVLLAQQMLYEGRY